MEDRVDAGLWLQTADAVGSAPQMTWWDKGNIGVPLPYELPYPHGFGVNRDDPLKEDLADVKAAIAIYNKAGIDLLIKTLAIGSIQSFVKILKFSHQRLFQSRIFVLSQIRTFRRKTRGLSEVAGHKSIVRRQRLCFLKTGAIFRKSCCNFAR